MLYDRTTLHDGFFNNVLNTIDVEDIDNVRVRNTGTAIYGAKGANGVIEITTKRGKSRATRIGVRLYGGFETTPSTLDVMNGEQHRNYLSEILGTYVPANATNRLSYLNGIATRSILSIITTRIGRRTFTIRLSPRTIRLTYRVVTKSPCMPSHWVTPSLTLRPVKTTSAV